jgi:hypothetical protein
LKIPEPPKAVAESGQQSMRAGILVVAVASLAVSAASPARSQDRTFNGFDCVHCSGYSAGYKWAERKGITDEDDCPDGHSQSFHEGCVAYTQGQVAHPDEDDDGGPVGHPGRRMRAPADDDVMMTAITNRAAGRAMLTGLPDGSITCRQVQLSRRRIYGL